MAMPTQASVSKFAFSDLALQSAIELERARAGEPFQVEPLVDLADALSITSRPEREGSPFRFVEPSFYEPFERLYRLERHKAETVEDIQQYVGDLAERLRAIKPGKTEERTTRELVIVCIALHRELIRELGSEDVLVRHEWRQPTFATAPGFS